MVKGQETRSKRKRRQGRVLTDKTNKSIVVWVERRLRHPRYGKVVKTGRKYHVHDENNEAHVGDIVDIVETRPISKLKRWRLEKIVRKMQAPERVEIGNGEDQLP